MESGEGGKSGEERRWREGEERDGDGRVEMEGREGEWR